LRFIGPAHSDSDSASGLAGRQGCLDSECPHPELLLTL